MTKAGKELKESYQMQARSQFKEKILIGALEIEIVLYFKTEAKHDIDNYGKILLDSLTGIVWNDDKQVVSMSVKKFVDRKNPRIEIKIL